jgi:hypothetical protein
VPLPCAISLLGTGIEGASLQKVGNGSLICLASFGCSGMYLSSVRLLCAGTSAWSPASSPPLEIEGAVLKLEKSSVVGCFSKRDGGSLRAYGGAIVQVREVDIHHIELET